MISLPDPAERARTIAARSPEAVLVPCAHTAHAERDPSRSAVRIATHLHHVHADATMTVLLPEAHPLVAAVWQSPRGAVTVMAELTDPAPVRLREPVRGLLWITGLLTALEGEQGRERALLVAEEVADPRLLDVGHGMSVLRVDPASLVLADADGTSSLQPLEFHEAVPDPFHDYETEWLRHLEISHRDVVGQLARHVPAELRGGQVRPLGLDRFGLRLRVEAADADHDIRLPFSRSVSTPEELAVELRKLVGCPFLAQATST
ncbi:DUF2470 domain-containing protein [Sciscionella marina]|uniref:DUF2470 domain-containing protein n=1 Tax=Sciscionella marina TaxID=508770 RepID=UPI00037A34C5|nr:DUF2470 domain-containing protein [Sciscionella marina]